MTRFRFRPTLESLGHRALPDATPAATFTLPDGTQLTEEELVATATATAESEASNAGGGSSYIAPSSLQMLIQAYNGAQQDIQRTKQQLRDVNARIDEAARALANIQDALSAEINKGANANQGVINALRDLERQQRDRIDKLKDEQLDLLTKLDQQEERARRILGDMLAELNRVLAVGLSTTHL